MKTSKFTDEQIALALRQAEAGTAVGEICRKLGVSEQTFYRWEKRSCTGPKRRTSCPSVGPVPRSGSFGEERLIHVIRRAS
jgi:transposase-like protein